MNAQWSPSRRRVHMTPTHQEICHRDEFSSQITGAVQQNSWTDFWFTSFQNQTLQRNSYWYLEVVELSTEITSSSRSHILHLNIHEIIFISVFFMSLFLKQLFVFCRFDHTPLATPNGDILISDLTFEVKLWSFIAVSQPDGQTTVWLAKLIIAMNLFQKLSWICFYIF